jgi:hypothetical protein
MVRSNNEQIYEEASYIYFLFGIKIDAGI